MDRKDCSTANCTVKETGRCLLSNDPYTTCPYYGKLSTTRSAVNNAGDVEGVETGQDDTDLKTDEGDTVEDDAAEGAAESEGVEAEGTKSVTDPFPSMQMSSLGSSALGDLSDEGRFFPAGLELGTDDAAELMRGQYGYLIGLLGPFNAGKTCFSLSLYLLATHGKLRPSYFFAGTETSQGFELRARRLRNWPEHPTDDQLTPHTRLDDPRSPALLHLALEQRLPVEANSGSIVKRRINLLITDLPGEWSSDLVKRATVAERFGFLKRADAIVLVVEGPKLLELETRHHAAHEVTLLLQRLVHSVGVDLATPVVLLISKSDVLAETPAEATDSITNAAQQLGLNLCIIWSAAFSMQPDRMASGTGIPDVLDKLLGRLELTPFGHTNPIDFPPATAGRAFSRFHTED